MTSRLALFVAAACLLLGYRLLLFWVRRKDQKLFLADPAGDRRSFGRTVIGWVVCLAWSFSADVQP